ncbi:hypothetical protein OYT1_ch2334 [Ferriphaselus amnicola]|uniref:Uncharacterized protein n=1 Tax=Ferriphaselus amnicola TaxID=1188319 RepID=A0A2Z6GEU8_9PROT|nr:hypothetical protein [Ferriphaselus amnicola]BBE51849.1 hypothetical protein OYT1_ch2334 [Ferriphaselus amnicola]
MFTSHILSFAQASELLGYCSLGAARQAAHRKNFPVPIHRRPGGRTIVVLSNDVEQYIKTGIPVASTNGTPLNAPAPSSSKRCKAGRPTERERKAAAELEMTVRQYRAMIREGGGS